MLSLGGSVSGDAKCVNIRLEHFAEGIINHAVPVYPADPFECLRDHHDVKVAFPAPGALVTNVQLTLILYQ